MWSNWGLVALWFFAASRQGFEGRYLSWWLVVAALAFLAGRFEKAGRN